MFSYRVPRTRRGPEIGQGAYSLVHEYGNDWVEVVPYRGHSLDPAKLALLKASQASDNPHIPRMVGYRNGRLFMRYYRCGWVAAPRYRYRGSATHAHIDEWLYDDDITPLEAEALHTILNCALEMGTGHPYWDMADRNIGIDDEQRRVWIDVLTLGYG